MKIEDFNKNTSSETKRTVLKYLSSNGQNGVTIIGIQAPFVYNNVYKFVKEFISHGIAEECGKTAPSTKSTFKKQAVKYRLTKNKGEKILKIIDLIEDMK